MAIETSLIYVGILTLFMLVIGDNPLFVLGEYPSQIGRQVVWVDKHLGFLDPTVDQAGFSHFRTFEVSALEMRF